MNGASNAQGIRNARKQAGLCTGCGKQPPAPERVKCRSCLDAHATEQKRNHEIKKWRSGERFARLKAAWL